MAECRIEVITYEQSRLEYFKELQNRQKKKKPSEFLIYLSNANRIKLPQHIPFSLSSIKIGLTNSSNT